MIVLLFFSTLALAQGSEQILGEDVDNGAKEIKVPSDAYDCTVVRLDALDETMLTIAERIERMDASLLDSIDQHDTCIDQVVNNNAASNSGAGSDSAGEDSETGSEAGSEPTLDASKDSDESSDQGKENTTEQGNSVVEQNSHQEQVENEIKLEGNGAKSQDIAPQDNDSAVCRLLKDELSVEKDPKKQSELIKIINNYNCRG